MPAMQITMKENYQRNKLKMLTQTACCTTGKNATSK